MGVNVLESLHDLEQNALDARVVKAFVISGLHQLVQIAFHILHADMELLSERVQEDVKCRNEVLVGR